MKEHRKQRLIRALSIVLVSALGVGTILYALNSNLDYFFTPSEMLMNDESKNISSSRRVKLGGMVKENSFSINGSIISFEITDFKETILVSYEGLLPDLFKEGKGIVVLGKMHNEVFYAEEVFAKHGQSWIDGETQPRSKACPKCLNPASRVHVANDGKKSLIELRAIGQCGGACCFQLCDNQVKRKKDQLQKHTGQLALQELHQRVVSPRGGT